MRKSQVFAGNILNGGHRLIALGLSCRDNCSSAAIALGAALDFPVTELTRLAETSAVGRFVRMPLRSERPVDIIGLILRTNHREPVRIEDLRSAIQHYMRFLGSRRGLYTRDAAMVAIGTGAARIEGGFQALLEILRDATYPGVVYQPKAPDQRLDEAALDRLGFEGGPDDPLPSWSCPRTQWTEKDDIEVLGGRDHDPKLVASIGALDSYLEGGDADAG